MLTFPERIARRVLNAAGLRSRHVVTKAGRIHLLEGEGDGTLPPIVILHGFAAHAVCYGGLLKRFQPHVRRVLAPDMLGHGYSDEVGRGSASTAMLAGLFEALDHVLTEPAILLGNSMGGLGAIRYALARPERVAGLALVSPGGAPLPPEEFEAFVERFRVETHGQALEFVEDIFAKVPTLMRHPLAHSIRRRFAHPNLRRLIEEISPGQMLSASDLRALRMPTLLVWGREEKLLPRAHFRFFVQNLPEHAFVEELGDFGHIGFMEQPAALTQRVLTFARHVAAKEIAHRRSTREVAHATLRASA